MTFLDYLLANHRDMVGLVAIGFGSVAGIAGLVCYLVLRATFRAWRRWI